MKPSLLPLLIIAGLAIAAEPTKETPAAPAAPETKPEVKPFYDPNAPAPTVDPTKPTPEPTTAAPEKGKSASPERAKKKKKGNN